MLLFQTATHQVKAGRTGDKEEKRIGKKREKKPIVNSEQNVSIVVEWWVSSHRVDVGPFKKSRKESVFRNIEVASSGRGVV